MDENYVNALVQDHYWESQDQCFCHEVLEPYPVETISFTFSEICEHFENCRMKFYHKFSTAKAHRFIPKEELKEIRVQFDGINKLMETITYKFLQVKNFSVECEFQYDDPWNLSRRSTAIIFDSLDSFRYFLYLDQTAKNLEKIDAALWCYIHQKRNTNEAFTETQYGGHLLCLSYRISNVVHDISSIYTHLHAGVFNPDS